MIKKFLFAVKMFFIAGKKDQTFLDAKWIRLLLKSTPQKYKKTVALNILALSPHYFFGEEKDKKSFLIREYKRNLRTRQLIFKYIVSDHITPQSVVMDYGCGPGFLAKIVASRTNKVYALDISDGVLLCANTINHIDNLHYLNVFKNQATRIADNSVDLIYSFAVLQHVSEDLIAGIFDLFYAKLKPNGKVLIQVQLIADGWKTELEWKKDTTLTGKLKYKYGLHAFSNSVSFYSDKLERSKLKFLSMVELKDVLPFAFDDIYKQQLIFAQKLPIDASSNFVYEEIPSINRVSEELKNENKVVSGDGHIK